MTEEDTYTATAIEKVQDVVLTESNGVAIHVQIGGDPNQLLFLDQTGAILLTQFLLEKGPPALGEEITLEFPADLESEHDVSEVQVSHNRDEPEPPFVMSFKLGNDTAVKLRVSHREVVRWHRRLGAQIREYIKQTAN